jgi:hypothetical protein
MLFMRLGVINGTMNGVPGLVPVDYSSLRIICPSHMFQSRQGRLSVENSVLSVAAGVLNIPVTSWTTRVSPFLTIEMGY